RVSSHSTINLSLSFPFSVTPLLPCSPLFPYPTLFRSADAAAPPARRLRVPVLQPAADVHGRAEHRAALPARRHPPRHRVVRHARDRKSTRLNSSHVKISYAVFCLKKKNNVIIRRLFRI